MIKTPAVINKAQHIINNIKRHCNCHADIWISTNYSLEQTDFKYLIDESDNVMYADKVFSLFDVSSEEEVCNMMYAFEIAVDGKVTSYMKNQVKYLNQWLAKYNTKHSTKFTCIGFAAEE